MTSQSIAYIIPGYLYSPEEERYKKIAEYFRERNILPIPVNIPWKEKTIVESVAHFIELKKHNPATKKYILGFSFGAIIALIASTKVPVDTLILCSLSPFFQEDLSFLPERMVKGLSKKQIEEFKTMNAMELVKKITAKTILLYGTKEGEFVEKRVKDTYENLTCEKQIIPIDRVKHDIANQKYQETIRDVISKL